jgi:hypothetical protein
MVLLPLACWLVGVIQVGSPATAYQASLQDLESNVPKDQWIYTRYLALWTVKPIERRELANSCAYWINGLHWRKQIIPLMVDEGGSYAPLALVSDRQLVRINLRYFDLDRYSRFDQLNRFQKLGAQYLFKDEYEKSNFLDIWDSIAKKDPYFRVNARVGDRLVRGWLEPSIEHRARNLTYSRNFCLRADWFLKQTGFDKPKGFYSDILMLPATEQELYKLVGADENFVIQVQSVQGGIVLKSDVALHGRGVELLKTQTGRDVCHLWRTLDVKNNIKERSVVGNLLGTVKFDGREVIATLPNGMHLYYLVDANRRRVGEVPTDIAQRKGHTENITVFNAWTCVACHDQGINKFKDVARALAVNRNTGIAGVVEGGYDPFKAKRRAENLQRKIDEYYGLGSATDLNSLIELHQVSYNLSIRAATGLSGGENSQTYISWIEWYTFEYVTLDQAAREMGFSHDVTLRLLKESDDEDLLALAGGEAIPRDAFEDSFPYAMQCYRYSWDFVPYKE